MFNEREKQIKIALAILVSLILIIVVVFLVSKTTKGIFKNGLSLNAGKENTLYSGVDKDTSGSLWSNIGNNGQDSNNEVKDEIIIPSKELKGEITSCEIEGNYGKVSIRNNEVEHSVELKVGSILFDGKTNKVVSPDSVKKGDKINVYTYEDLEQSKLDIDIAEVVILSPTDDIGYTPILNLNKEAKKIEFSVKDKQYVVEGQLYSALTGIEYGTRQLEELDEGFRLIYYGKEKQGKIQIDKGFVYPTFK